MGTDVDATKRTLSAIALVHAVGTAAGKKKQQRRSEWVVSRSKLEVERGGDRGEVLVHHQYYGVVIGVSSILCRNVDSIYLVSTLNVCTPYRFYIHFQDYMEKRGRGKWLPAFSSYFFGKSRAK